MDQVDEDEEPPPQAQAPQAQAPPAQAPEAPAVIVVGFTGEKHHGKDTAAKYKEDALRFAFADPLKEAVMALYDMSYAQVYDEALKDVIDPRYGVTPRKILQELGTDFVRERDVDHFLKLMDAKIGRVIASDAASSRGDPGFSGIGRVWSTEEEEQQHARDEELAEWKRAVAESYAELRPIEEPAPAPVVKRLRPTVLVTDVRFANEAELVKRHGGLVIKVWRTINDGKPKDTHASEAGIPEQLVDYTFENNGTKQELWDKVQQAVDDFFKA